jgi:HlyD family secretion protein
VKRATALMLLLLALGAAGWVAFALDYAGQLRRRNPSTDTVPPAQPLGGKTVETGAPVGALGRIQPADGIVRLGALAGERLGQLLVHEGDVVERGAPLAYVESRSLRKIEVDALIARIAEATAQRAAQEKLSDAKIVVAQSAVSQVEAQQADIDAQQQKLELLDANLASAEKDAERLADLSDDLVSDREREHQDLAVRQAKAEVVAGKALLKKLIAVREVSLVAANADLGAARAAKQQALDAIPLDSLKKNLELAQATYDRTTIAAPSHGTILKIYAREGELLGTSPVLDVANLDRLVVNAEVYETDVKRITVGQPARITSRALAAPLDRDGLSGTVARVGRMVGAAGLASLDPTAPADRRVVEVRIDLDAASSRQAAGWIGLQVDVVFSGK